MPLETASAPMACRATSASGSVIRGSTTRATGFSGHRVGRRCIACAPCTTLSLPQYAGKPFDPSFFMYCEDVDLNWRAGLSGYETAFAPDAVVYHHLSATAGGPLASYYVGRNMLAVLMKDVPGPVLRRHSRRDSGSANAVRMAKRAPWAGTCGAGAASGAGCGIGDGASDDPGAAGSHSEPDV